MTGSNCGPLVSEETALPTEPHNHCPPKKTNLTYLLIHLSLSFIISHAFKNRLFPVSFFLFAFTIKVKVIVQFIFCDDWIRTTDLWGWK